MMKNDTPRDELDEIDAKLAATRFQEGGQPGGVVGGGRKDRTLGQNAALHLQLPFQAIEGPAVRLEGGFQGRLHRGDGPQAHLLAKLKPAGQEDEGGGQETREDDQEEQAGTQPHSAPGARGKTT